MKNLLFLILLTGFCASAHADRASDPYEGLRARAQHEYNQGNWKDAFDLYEQFIYEPDADEVSAAREFTSALSCLVNLNRDHETDDVREKMAEAHAGSWRVLHAVAESYVNLIPTAQGGTHVNGFRLGLTEALREYCELRNLTSRSTAPCPDGQDSVSALSPSTMAPSSSWASICQA